MCPCPMTADDVPAVIEFFSSMEEGMILEWETDEVVRDFILRCPRQGYIVKDRGMLIACAFVSDGLRGLLHHVAVAPLYRKGGIGTRLVQAILRDYYHRTKVGRIQAVVLTSNETALRFWSGFGMQQSSATGGRTVTFYIDLKDQPWL